MIKKLDLVCTMLYSTTLCKGLIMTPLEILTQERARFVLTSPKFFKSWTTQTKDRISVRDICLLDSQTLGNFGFMVWERNLLLFPVWAIGLLANGEELVSIRGTSAVIGRDDINCDTRVGVLSYGCYYPYKEKLDVAAGS